MSRDQALNLVRLFDGHYPEEFIEEYLEYYQMDITEFNGVLDKYANKDLFRKEKNSNSISEWKPNFAVDVEFEI